MLAFFTRECLGRQLIASSQSAPGGKVRKRVNERGRCNLRFAVKNLGRVNARQKETPPVRKKTTESVAASSATWETLETFARQSMQQLLQRMLEEEVDGVLGRARYERRDAVDAVAGYRNGFGKPRRLSLSSGTIALRAPAGARAERALREPAAAGVQARRRPSARRRRCNLCRHQAAATWPRWRGIEAGAHGDHSPRLPQVAPSDARDRKDGEAWRPGRQNALGEVA